jgi:hypothetical protein
MRIVRSSWIIAALLNAVPAIAEVTAPTAGPWKVAVTAGVNLSQSSFSSNWAGGDQGSIVWVLNSNTTAERQFNSTLNLSNLLQLSYGQTARQVADPANPSRLTWDSPDKTTDLISFESVGRFSVRSFVDPYFSLRLDSQFRDQSYPNGVIAFNPVKLKETAGIARVLQKTEDAEAITRLGFGFRQTIAKSFVDPASDRKASFTSNDGGFEWNTTVTRPLLEKRVLYKGTLLVFQPVFYSKSAALDQFDADALAADPTREPITDFWKSTDVSFQNTFSAAITKVLSVNLFAQWVYDKFDAAANVDNSQPLPARIAEIDKNVRKAGQFKETLAVGLTFRLL